MIRNALLHNGLELQENSLARTKMVLNSNRSLNVIFLFEIENHGCAKAVDVYVPQGCGVEFCLFKIEHLDLLKTLH